MSTGWLASKAVGLETCIWADGRAEWEPVARIPELAAQLQVAEAALTGAQAAGAPATLAAGACVS